MATCQRRTVICMRFLPGVADSARIHARSAMPSAPCHRCVGRIEGPAQVMPTMSDTPSNDDLKQAALDYHRVEPRGKIKVVPTKPMVTQRDLALAYSPGVAFACERSEERRVGKECRSRW